MIDLTKFHMPRKTEIDCAKNSEVSFWVEWNADKSGVYMGTDMNNGGVID